MSTDPKTGGGMSPLTKNEKRILEFITEYSEDQGVAPTFVEIQEHFGYKAINSVQQYVKQLKSKGHLETESHSNQKRALQIAPLESSSPGAVPVPLEGIVAAGHLTEAIHQNDSIEVPSHFLKRTKEYFALTVKGDSMIEDCILSGDTVIVERTHQAQNGQTVVAMVEDEATLKRYYRREQTVELHPANPDYPIIKVKHESFKILGVLAHVLRSYL